mmetsp:Transcript_28183/g.89772  ORF Transcript_28183/g.89772 Transcript_28183/m.89772 type:complete len:343 (+) Transcript_28183:1-1029(+)
MADNNAAKAEGGTDEEEVIPAMQVKAPKPGKSGGLFGVVGEVQKLASEITGGNARAGGTANFVLGMIFGIFIGMLIMYANHHMVLQKERVKHLKEVVSINGNTKADTREGLICRNKLKDMEETMKVITDSDDGVTLVQRLNQTQNDLEKCTKKCGLCHNCEVLVERSLSKQENVHFAEIKKLEVRIQEQERKVSDSERKAEMEQIDKTAECDEHVKSATSKVLRVAENARRDLDMRLHNENIKHDAAADRAIRSRDMAIKDRDTVAQSKKAVEGELQQCLASLATANKGNDRDISKIQGELKSMGEGISECENRFVDLSTNFCSMCNHCTTVSFPACQRVCR